jgi:hypothetical protein
MDQFTDSTLSIGPVLGYRGYDVGAAIASELYGPAANPLRYPSLPATVSSPSVLPSIPLSILPLTDLSRAACASGQTAEAQPMLTPRRAACTLGVGIIVGGVASAAVAAIRARRAPKAAAPAATKAAKAAAGSTQW